ncbi:cytidine deaminase 1-like [Silene latifolia]|uniref:cytidine deaminase 1-like n=1 Tax=Silene latifolia TaxID=37657 RepID=UPI003D78B30B
MIESYDAKSIAKKQGFDSVFDFLPIIVRSAQKVARPPISGFSVVAVGLASDGRIFIRVNVEFPGLPLHHSIHAEQFLIANLTCYPQTTLTNVVVSAYPCRQFLQEIRAAPHIQISVLQTHDHDFMEENEFRPLSYFLPNRFCPHDLLEKDVPLILETHDNGMILLSQQFINGQNDALDKVVKVAERRARDRQA